MTNAVAVTPPPSILKVDRIKLVTISESFSDASTGMKLSVTAKIQDSTAQRIQIVECISLPPNGLGISCTRAYSHILLNLE